MSKSACLAVLNFNGVKHLEHLLPGLQDAACHSKIPARIVVLDNRSTVGDVDWLKRHHPGVGVAVAPHNDFLFSYNWLLQTLSEDYVVLLNNDLRVDRNFLNPLFKHLAAPDVFSVSACSFDWEGKNFTSGPVKLSIKHGFYTFLFDKKRQERCHTLFGSGGFMAIDRRKFLALGGFNRLFFPAYCEDLDLCFRAWKRGWRSIYEPESIVWHREHATWAESPLTRTNRLYFRNALLFQWSSLPMRETRWERRYSWCKVMLGALRRRDWIWFGDFRGALLTWRRAQKEYAWMKTTGEELDLICERIDEALGRAEARQSFAHAAAH